MTDRTHPHVRHTRVARGLVVALCLTTPMACGGSGGADRVTSAARRSPPPAAELVALAGTRSAQAASVTLDATVTQGGELVSRATSASSADGSRVAVTAELPGSGGFEARAVDGIWYVRAPVPSTGTEWISIDPGSFGGLAPMVDDLVDADPRAVFDGLSRVGSDVTEVGRDQVEGVPTTHYRMTIDARQLAAGVVPNGPAAAPGAAPLDVWIDDDGFVRRIRCEFDDRGGAGAPDAPYVLEATVLASDVPADVTVPPADDTVALEELIAEGGIGALADVLSGALGGD